MNSILLVLALAAQKDPSSTKEAMRAVQLLVGEWKAQVQPEGGGEAWEETQKWEYRIEKETYSLSFTTVDGKLFKAGTMAYDLKRKLYRLEAEGGDGKTAAFEGKLAGKELPLEEVVAAEGPQRRLLFNLLRDNRISWASRNGRPRRSPGSPATTSPPPSRASPSSARRDRNAWSRVARRIRN
jgi:hypothetical protein